LGVYISYQLFDSNIINEDDIDDEDANLFEVIVSTIILGILVTVSYYLFHLHWIETLSISVLLANQVSNLSHRMTGSFLKIQP